MALARVWNDHPSDYKEMFKGEMIEIPGKKYVEMDKYDAIQFVGQYIPVRKNDLGDYINHKMLRVEVLPDPTPKVTEIKCQMCLGKFDTEKELALHSEAHHKDAIVEKKK